jgi:hypothetical protein
MRRFFVGAFLGAVLATIGLGAGALSATSSEAARFEIPVAVTVHGQGKVYMSAWGTVDGSGYNLRVTGKLLPPTNGTPFEIVVKTGSFTRKFRVRAYAEG